MASENDRILALQAGARGRARIIPASLFLPEGIPIVGPVVGNLLEILVQTARARSILELGTATGYSAIFSPEDARISAER